MGLNLPACRVIVNQPHCLGLVVVLERYALFSFDGLRYVGKKQHQ
ncbi:MAG: hypothetical protein Ct9H300mP28_23870 [Pseudomonadota bacterium]|nr:MAG: hypothetical protein Ct9H300mP28_23870 [Pseudomonadota bacterium]